MTNGELFALVAYALEVRKKGSGLSWDMNFSSRLSRAVRHHPNSIDKDMATCLCYFNSALEKCLTQQPQTLYCSSSADPDYIVSFENGGHSPAVKRGGLTPEALRLLQQHNLQQGDVARCLDCSSSS